MTNTIHHSIFSRHLNNIFKISTPNITKEGKVYTPLRAWQQEAFAHLKDERQVLIQAATGAGKSVTMMMLAAHKMTQNPFMRTICSVSYKDIGNGFSKPFNHIVDGKEVSFQVENNIACNDADDRGKIQAIIDFMQLKDVSGLSLGERTLVCTHASLVAARKRKPDLFTNSTDFICIVDETHHSSSQEEEYNGLAGVIHDVMAEPSNQLILATATFMRGDGSSIVNKEIQKELKTYKFALDKHLENAIYLKHFDMAVSLCNSSDASIEEIKNLCDNDKNTIIWIPHTNSLNSLSYPDKDDLVTSMIEAIKEVRGDDAIISDWVTGHDDEEEHDLTDMKTFKGVLIAMNRFKEGSDWEAAEQGIVLGERGSLPDMIQMYGRLFRDYPGKESIHMHQILPCRFGRISAESEEFKKEVNNHWKVICSLMLMEDIFDPIVLRDKKNKSEGDEGKIRTNYLDDITKSDKDKKELSDWFNDQILQMASEKDVDGELSKEELVDLADEAIASFDLADADSELLAEYFTKRWKRKSIEKGISVDSVDFEFRLSVQDITDRVGSKDVGFSILKDYRRAMTNQFDWSLALVKERSKEVHLSKNYFYDFPENNKDIKNDSKIKIGCNDHDKMFAWEAIVDAHVGSRKTGCPKCFGSEKYTLSNFIEKSKVIHGDEYDYSNVKKEDIKGKDSKVNIFCKINDHGFFKQQITSHINRKQGCPKCYGLEKYTLSLISCKEQKLLMVINSIIRI